MTMSDDLVKRLRTPVGCQDLPFIQEEAADRIEQLEAQLEEAHMQSLSALGQALDSYEAQKKAEAELDAAYKRGLEDALEAIANLPTPRSESTMEGHEQSYRAIEAIRAKIQENDE